ncbi:DUF2911 domain-containing protein [bacterium]|nr:DUF2911 domain-containing protein [bacterium]
MKKLFTMALMLSLLAYAASAQQLITLPEASPRAEMMQTIGLTTITINYGSPAVNGRKVWGDLVPYGLAPSGGFGSGNPMPWRAGANVNTTITFNHDVTVQGKPLAAGTYGVHMIPTEKDWTIIFSKNHESWGSFWYNEAEDALRVTTTPVKMNDHQERLCYGFDEMTYSSTIAYLRWEKLKVPFKIETNTPQIILANLRNELRNTTGFTWQGWNQAAGFCVQYNINLEEGLTWAEKAIAFGGGGNAQLMKARVLAQMGKTKEADDLIKATLETATEAEINNYGYQLLGQKKTKEAVEVFKVNVRRFPKSWNAYDSLADGYDQSGDKKLAVENYKKAMQMTTDENQKKRIDGILKKLQM